MDNSYMDSSLLSLHDNPLEKVAMRVFVRMKPLPRHDLDAVPIEMDHNTILIKIFETIAKTLVKDFIDGYNATILCYGQTGSGKTYTMYGPDPITNESMGIAYRLVKDIFTHLERIQIGQMDDHKSNGSQSKFIETSLKLSYLEIVNDMMINDLLDSHHSKKEIVIRRDGDHRFYAVGAKEVFVNRPHDAFTFIQEGNSRRHVSSTLSNEKSSRSHAVLMFTLTQINMKNKISSRFVLVDLAGSERVSKTGAVGEILQQAKGINTSLFSLGRVIIALQDNTLVPYRDSPLTKLLKESLGGNSKTSFVINCSLEQVHYEESKSSLQFAARLKKIKNKTKINKKISPIQLETQLLISNHISSYYSLQNRILQGWILGKYTYNPLLLDKELEKLKKKALATPESHRSLQAKLMKRCQDTSMLLMDSNVLGTYFFCNRGDPNDQSAMNLAYSDTETEFENDKEDGDLDQSVLSLLSEDSHPFEKDAMNGLDDSNSKFDHLLSREASITLIDPLLNARLSSNYSEDEMPLESIGDRINDVLDFSQRQNVMLDDTIHKMDMLNQQLARYYDERKGLIEDLVKDQSELEKMSQSQSFLTLKEVLATKCSDLEQVGIHLNELRRQIAEKERADQVRIKEYEMQVQAQEKKIQSLKDLNASIISQKVSIDSFLAQEASCDQEILSIPTIQAIVSTHAPSSTFEFFEPCNPSPKASTSPSLDRYEPPSSPNHSGLKTNPLLQWYPSFKSLRIPFILSLLCLATFLLALNPTWRVHFFNPLSNTMLVLMGSYHHYSSQPHQMKTHHDESFESIPAPLVIPLDEEWHDIESIHSIPFFINLDQFHLTTNPIDIQISHVFILFNIKDTSALSTALKITQFIRDITLHLNHLDPSVHQSMRDPVMTFAAHFDFAFMEKSWSNRSQLNQMVHHVEPYVDPISLASSEKIIIFIANFKLDRAWQFSTDSFDIRFYKWLEKIILVTSSQKQGTDLQKDPFCMKEKSSESKEKDGLSKTNQIYCMKALNRMLHYIETFIFSLLYYILPLRI